MYWIYFGKLEYIFAISFFCGFILQIQYIGCWWSGDTRSYNINSSPHSAVYMCGRTGSAFVQIVACPLDGAKQLSEPMLIYCPLDPKEHISVKFYLKFKFSHCLNMTYAKWKPFYPRWRWVNSNGVDLVLQIFSTIILIRIKNQSCQALSCTWFVHQEW